MFRALLLSLLLSLQIFPTHQHGALVNPLPRNSDGTDWNSGNIGSQYKGWTDGSGNPTIEPCGNSKWLVPGNVKQILKEGSCFDIEVAISAQHMGYYEFRLCNNSFVDKKQLTNCFLNSPLLKRANPLPMGEISTYKINTPPQWTQQQADSRWRQHPEDGELTGVLFRGYQVRKMKYCLPNNFSCDKCVLQWYWQSLNSWQVESAATLDTTSGERFWNCADIQIVKSDKNLPITETCGDGIKNQNEDAIDCGGVCRSCENGGCQNEYAIVKNNLISYHVDCQNGKSIKCCSSLDILINNVKKFCASPEDIGLSEFLFYKNVYGCSSNVPSWELNTLYKTGNKILFEGVMYECLQPHSSTVGWEPPIAISLWRKIG
jgi:hypothetical protein